MILAELYSTRYRTFKHVYDYILFQKLNNGKIKKKFCYDLINTKLRSSVLLRKQGNYNRACMDEETGLSYSELYKF